MAKYSTGSRREALCAWLTANGIDPKAVPLDADMTIDKGPTGRFLRCEVFDRDGQFRVDERGTSVARLIINVPLKVEPPEWWQPYQKPTREHLLNVLERARAVADSGPPSGVAVSGEWEGGWDSAMETVKKVLGEGT